MGDSRPLGLIPLASELRQLTIQSDNLGFAGRSHLETTTLRVRKDLQVFHRECSAGCHPARTLRASAGLDARRTTPR
jgi:hypothetical protein